MNRCLGCYIRLSHADDDKNRQNESNSVHNQRELILNYLSARPEFHDWNIQEFVDDGYTGTNENRPEFQRMINLIHLGQIHCVIVKDFSRFARNYLIMGNYLEQVFPLLGVRFISVNDAYDSMTSINSLDAMSMTLKSILHSYYSRDLSAKIYAVNTQRMKTGQHVGTPCFGYTLNEDRTCQIIDPEAAAIVRMIYDMALSGKTRPEIVRYLNDHHIPTPAEYNNLNSRKRSTMITPNPLWDHGKVSRILRQEEYTGKLIMRKHVQPVPCVRKYRKSTLEEIIVRESAHDAIVTREEYDRVQRMLPKRKGWDRKNQRLYPLKGLVRCGTCGKVMCAVDTPAPGGLQCKDSLIEHAVCSSVIHPMEDIEQTIYLRIKHLLPLIEWQQERQSKCRKRPSNESAHLSSLRREQQEVQQEKVSLYEQYIAGTLTLEEYLVRKQQVKQLEQAIKQQSKQITQQRADIPITTNPSELAEALGLANRYGRNSELTHEMARSFIDAVLVFDDCIKIKWKYPWLETLMED